MFRHILPPPPASGQVDVVSSSYVMDAGFGLVAMTLRFGQSGLHRNRDEHRVHIDIRPYI